MSTTDDGRQMFADSRANPKARRPRTDADDTAPATSESPTKRVLSLAEYAAARRKAATKQEPAGPTPAA